MIVNKGRGKADKHEAEVVPLRAEVAMLKQDLIDLRTKSAVRSDSDVVFIAKCQKVEKERDDIRFSVQSHGNTVGVRPTPTPSS